MKTNKKIVLRIEKTLSENELKVLKFLAENGSSYAYEMNNRGELKVCYNEIRKILEKLEESGYVTKQESEGETKRKKVLYGLTIYGLSYVLLSISGPASPLFDYVSSLLDNWKELDNIIFKNWRKIAEVFPKEEILLALFSSLELVKSPPPIPVQRIWRNPMQAFLQLMEIEKLNREAIEQQKTVTKEDILRALEKHESKEVSFNYDGRKDFRKQFFFFLFQLYCGSTSSLEELATKIKKIPEVKDFVISCITEKLADYSKLYNDNSYLLKLLKES
ncbi:MAG: hypothetical protein ACP5IT_10925 [Thermoproteota archaeon]|jgi:DNA-binding PadR family transcriptional regulator